MIPPLNILWNMGTIFYTKIYDLVSILQNNLKMKEKENIPRPTVCDVVSAY